MWGRDGQIAGFDTSIALESRDGSRCKTPFALIIFFPEIPSIQLMPRHIYFRRALKQQPAPRHHSSLPPAHPTSTLPALSRALNISLFVVPSPRFQTNEQGFGGVISPGCRRGLSMGTIIGQIYQAPSMRYIRALLSNDAANHITQMTIYSIRPSTLNMGCMGFITHTVSKSLVYTTSDNKLKRSQRAGRTRE